MKRISPKLKALLAATVLENPYIPHKPTAKQAEFLLYSGRECLFGGAAGPGKSSGLLMSALMYVTEPDYSALILRRTYADLSLPGAIMDRADEWLRSTDAQWQDKTKTWTFPSGATLTFGYLETENDKYRYQGAEFQMCVAEGTPVLMADGSYKPIENICLGDHVMTLEGPHRVNRTWGHKVSECVKVEVYDSQLKKIGEQIHPIDHRILTAFGWHSYASICSLFDTSEPTLSHSSRISSLPLAQIYPFLSQMSLFRCPLMQQREQDSQFPGLLGCAEGDALSIGGRSYCKAFVDEHQESRRLLSLCVPVMLHAPSLHRGSSVSTGYEVRGELIGREATSNSQLNCLSCFRQCGAQFQCLIDTGQDVLPLLTDAVEHIPPCCWRDEKADIPIRARMHSIEYIHPYTMDSRSSSEVVQLGSCVITPCGERIVYDISVEDVHHYITYTHLVNKNCAFDELTQFTESQYTYLFSRLRKLEGSNIPIRMRSATNPGGIGGQWVKDRFITQLSDDRLFIPARLGDNPYLNQEQYKQSLQLLDPVTRAQLEDGNWDIAAKGEMFKRKWIEIVDTVPKCDKYVRYWDCASTKEDNKNDPDWTVGVLMGVLKGVYYVIDVQRFREDAGESDDRMEQQAKIDGRDVPIREEQEGGSSGKKIISVHSKGIFRGYDYEGIPSSGNKVHRAKPYSAACKNGNVKMVSAPWNNMYLWELEMFPTKGVHDDQMDASSGAYNELCLEHTVNAKDLANLFKTKPRRP